MRRLNSGDRTRPSQDSSSCQSVRPAHTLSPPLFFFCLSHSLSLMIVPIFICLFPLLPFSSFLFTAELEQNFQVQGCRKAAAQTTTTTVATHPAPDSRGRGQWGLEAHKTRRQLCLPFFAATHTKWLPHRERKREGKRENEREREHCVGRHFVRVCAQRFLHTVAISF